ncbi:MAG: hypothetical protein EXS37_02130 [Opitutus sp.]|nr:hypothetical protein [Opitutus sp.]
MLVGLLGAVPPCAIAQVIAEGNLAASRLPEMAALLAAQPRWSLSTEVETAFGYKDNLLLSSRDEERSAFVRGGAEVFLMNTPRGKVDYSLLAQVEGTRFFSGRTVDHEAEAWLQSELGYRLTETFKLSLVVTGYYFDQVLDQSDTTAARIIARYKVGGAMAGPMVRWAFHRAWWIEGQAVGERKRYDDEANDSRIDAGSVRLGWRVVPQVEARLELQEKWYRFDERVKYSPAGRALSGTELRIAEREGELRVDVDWDKARRWKTSTRVGVLRYRDNGSGYFSNDRKKIGHEVTWKGEAWLVRLDAIAERVEFRVQTVGIGIDPPPRIKDEVSAKLRIERKLSERWTIFARYNWERTRSNDQIASFNVNEGLLGARWSWEK